MAKIAGIYVPISADIKQLRSDMGQAKQIVTESANSMVNSLNGALSGDRIKSGVNSLVSNLSTLSQASKNIGADFSKLGVNLREFQNVTGTSASQFAKLQGQLLQTQAAKAQEKALSDIARQAGLTSKEIQVLGKQFGLSQSQISSVAKSTTGAGSAFSGLLGYITPAIAGMIAFQRVVTSVADEFKFGLKAVEDFGMGIAQSTALITTFSQKAKDGNIAGAYIEANKYAKELMLSLEMIDQKTIANSKDLQVMSETFIANGVLLDINNKKQIEGFTSVANALAIMTQGQNKDIQMRQEIRGLMDGEIRSQDKLGMLLKAQIPDIEKQLKIWQQEGTVLENLGGLLKGFGATTVLIEAQWATVGSTMETIHTRVLRGMFEPVFKDLIQMAKALNKSMMDAEGNLTPLARGLIAMFKDAYAASKTFFDSNEKGWAMMIAKSTIWGQQFSLAAKGFEAATGLISDYGSTVAENTDQQITELEGKLKTLTDGNKEWYQFSLFKDPQEDMRYADEIKGKINELKQTLSSAKDSENEFMREKVRAIGGSAIAPTLARTPGDPTKSKASDLNAGLNAELELLKAQEEKRAAMTKAANSLLLQENQNSYDVGLTSYSKYLDARNELTKSSLQAELAAKEKSLADAQAALSKISPVTDKDGNSRPDKDAKNRTDALKKIEDAERAVIEARNKLTEAEVSGGQQAKVANEETARSYKSIEIQLLEMQGKTIEAAQLMAEYDEESIERKRLILAADEGVAGAQQALDAERLKSSTAIKNAELDQISVKNEARLALAEIDGEYYKSLDIQIGLLDVEIQRAEVSGKLPEQIALLKRQREELEKMKDPLSAFAKGWQDVIKEQRSASELMASIGADTAKNMQTGFSDMFFGVMKGEFSSLADIAESTFNRILDSFMRMAADMAAQQVMSSVFGSTSTGKDGEKTETAGWVGTAWDAVAEWWSESEWADGGYMAANPGGGTINAGSGIKDDVFLGYTDGGRTVNYGMGGEYIMPKEQTAKYFPILENMRRNYAEGGTVGRGKVYSRFQQLVDSMQAAGVQSGVTAGGMQALMESIYEANGAAIERTESINEVTAATKENIAATKEKAEAVKESSVATTTAKEKSFDLSDSLVDLGFSIVDVATDAIAAAAGFGPLGPSIKDAGLQALGLTEAMAGVKQSIKDTINEIQEALGVAQAAAAEASGFGGYNIGDLYGESVDPLSYEVNNQSGDSGSSNNGTTGSVGSDGMGYNGESDNESGWADGGWLARNGSGWINQGSGVKDDVFLGHSDGGRTRNFGMGGEFVTRKDRAAEWASELEYINTHRKLDFTPPPRNSAPAMSVGAMQSAPDKIVVNIHGKGIEAIIDKVIVTRERQGVSGRAYI